MTINQLLQWKHVNSGINLEQTEDFLFLTCAEHKPIIMSAVGATPESILAEADNYLRAISSVN